MPLRSLVPFQGDKSTRRKIQELEEKAGTLPIFFSLFILEAVKTVVIAIGYKPPLALTYEMGALIDSLKFLVLGIAVALVYIYDEERKALTEKTKEKAGEAGEKAKEKAGEAKDKANEVKEKATGEGEE